MYPRKTAEGLLREFNAPRRNHFFYGKRMDVQHFEMEQSYGKLKQWLLNRLTLGKGVLCGLRVTVDGNRICVDPGAAIDGLGREIIVPVRSCIDPLATDDGCCGSRPAPATPPTTPNPTNPDGTPATGTPPTEGIFTLWLCYHECLADPQASLVSDCGTRDQCAAGTVVESFCLKTTTGLPPLPGDPDWCAMLWGKDSTPEDPNTPPVVTPGQPPSASTPGAATPVSSSALGSAAALGLTAADMAAIDAAMKSRRHTLCELFDDTCDAGDADPCIPLAVIVLRDGRYTVESCLVRPRIYSNAKLLDLILCLAEKIDACCNGHETPVELMHVTSVAFLNRTPNGETPITSIQSPLQETAVSLAANPNSIRIRFSKPFAQDQHKPTTPGLNDPDFKVHNVQILPEDVLNNVPFVPGTLTIESPDTVRFDLSPESPYMRDNVGWQKGRYRIFLRGKEDLPSNHQALADLTSKALDGEAIAPAGGVMSGDGVAGGDFIAKFVVGGGGQPQPQPQETLRVSTIDFVDRTPGAPERTVGKVTTPLESPLMTQRLTSIRIRFNRAFAQDELHIPTIHGRNDTAFTLHNVQLLPSEAEVRARGVEFVPAELTIESADTIRIDVLRDTRIIDGNGNWPAGLSNYRIFLRGKAGGRATRAPIVDLDTKPLDGEPIAPASGVISGDGTPGGDFLATFSVRRTT